MHDIFLAIIASGLLSMIVSEVFSYLRERRKEKNKKESSETSGIRMSLYLQLKDRCKKHIADGYIAAEDLEDLIMAHRVYHDKLNGNGYLDAMMKKVKQLPIKE